jgi:maltoporin
MKATKSILTLLILSTCAVGSTTATAQPADPAQPTDRARPAEPPTARPTPDTERPTPDTARPTTPPPRTTAKPDAASNTPSQNKAAPARTSAKSAIGAPPPVHRKKPAAAKDTGFGFGSYGRVGISTDGQGGPGQQFNQTAHGPRLGEGPYLELDLYYRMRPYRDVRVQTVVTLAFTEQLFHFDGDWASGLALRNLYLEGQDLFVRGLSLWIGSRMYRGDDIYLLDFWPLDNLNTVGGGVSYAFGHTKLAWHLGVNRLADQYQYQEVAVPGLNNSSELIVLLNRQRMITSLKATQEFGGKNGKLGAKLKIYGEYHFLPSGTLDAHLPAEEQEHLRADHGWLAGLQAGLWNFGPRSHVNLFLRYAQGLAAYGEFAIPFGLATDKRAKNAREFVLAVSANFELKRWFGVQFGGYARYFKDADPNEYDWDDGWEYVAVVRPHVFLHKLFAVAFELSYQARNPAGLNPWTHQAETPGVTKFAVMPLLTFGKGTYARPQLRLIYMLVHQNDSARMSHNPEDPRRDLKVGHYIGLQAEWWFNSTYR